MHATALDMHAITLSGPTRRPDMKHSYVQLRPTSGPTVKWPFQVLPYTNSEVKEFCVDDEEWQKFRLMLKGTPTFKKLEMLNLRRDANILANSNKLEAYVDRRCQVQIDNYINALRRGGQLNLKNEVVK